MTVAIYLWALQRSQSEHTGNTFPREKILLLSVWNELAHVVKLLFFLSRARLLSNYTSDVPINCSESINHKLPKLKSMYFFQRVGNNVSSPVDFAALFHDEMTVIAAEVVGHYWNHAGIFIVLVPLLQQTVLEIAVSVSSPSDSPLTWSLFRTRISIFPVSCGICCNG